jgi:hypothetical protein
MEAGSNWEQNSSASSKPRSGALGAAAGESLLLTNPALRSLGVLFYFYFILFFIYRYDIVLR